MKSKVDYFDIHIGDTVTLVEFVEAHKSVGKDGRDVSQSLDIYKIKPEGSNKIHYLYAHEVDTGVSTELSDASGVPNVLVSGFKA